MASLRVTLRRPKTDQDGQGRTIAIMPGENPATCAVAAVRVWLKEADIQYEGENPAFRMVRGRSADSTRHSDKAVDHIVKAAAGAAGLKDSYSAHSLRAGHVIEALTRGSDRDSIKRQTGHHSDSMLDRYAREADLTANNSSSGIGL